MNEIESALIEFVTEHFAVDSVRMGMDLRDDLDLSDGEGAHIRLKVGNQEIGQTVLARAEEIARTAQL